MAGSIADFVANNTFHGDEAGPMEPGHPAGLGSLDYAMQTCRTPLEEAAEIRGVDAADIAKAAEWIAKPHDDGPRRKCVTGREKGVTRGTENYRTVGAVVNLALATGYIGREGTGCCRFGGHQEGYDRPSDADVGRPAVYFDQHLIKGNGKVHHIWACDHYKTTLNATQFKKVMKKRSDMVKEAMDAASNGPREEMVEAIVPAVNAGGLFVVDMDIIHGQIATDADVILPACESNEMNLTSMHGEWRLRISERYMDPFGNSKPDSLIAAGVAQNMERVLREMGNDTCADQFKGYDGERYHPVASGSCIRREGEDAAKGSVLLPAGMRLGAREIGVIASVGFAQIRVRCKVGVALICTGSELRQPGARKTTWLPGCARRAGRSK